MDITLKKNKEWEQVLCEMAGTSAIAQMFDAMPRSRGTFLTFMIYY